MRREPADCSKPLARVFAAEEKAASATPTLNLLSPLFLLDAHADFCLVHRLIEVLN